MIQFSINETQLRAALEAVGKREEDGTHCFAVFELVTVGNSLADCRAGFSGETIDAEPA